MVKTYRTSVTRIVVQLAQEDPELVLAFIHELKQSGQIEADDLAHIERIARQWIRIARENRDKGVG